MLQLEYLEIDGQQEDLETWVDLVNIYDGETVSTFVFQGRYTIGGVIDDGLVLTGNGRILLLDHEGNSYSFEIELENPTGWQNGFRSIEAHGKHIALLTPDGQEMAIVDVESKTTTPVAKPGPGVWIPSRIPISLISSFSITQGDQFVIGFRSPTGDWSLHTISLTEQSSQQLGEYRLFGNERGVRARAGRAGVFHYRMLVGIPREGGPWWSVILCACASCWSV